jgi:hypothetical protein
MRGIDGRHLQFLLSSYRRRKRTMCWEWKRKSWSFIEKIGYIVTIEKAFVEEHKWWQSFVLGTHAPLKSKLLTWLTLENKLPTWDNGLKRGWIGPSRCIMCMEEMEKMQHLFVSCSFTQRAWSTTKNALKL